MCIRINNLSQAKNLLKYFNQECHKMMNAMSNMAMKYDSSTNMPALHVKMEAYKSRTSSRAIETKIENIQNGMIKLLVFRFNLFCRKAMEILLNSELAAYPNWQRLKPLNDFLSRNLEMIKKLMYPHILNKFMKLLWDSFHEVNFDT